MKKTWEMKILNELCKVEYGTRVVQRRDGGSIYPVYGGGGATFTVDNFNRENRVVVARFGMSECCTRFVSGKFFLNDSGLTLTSKNTKVLIQAFLDKWTIATNDDIFALGKGAAQKNLDVSKFRCLQIPLPSISEQQHIVSILDEASTSISAAMENAEKYLQYSRALFESYRETIFTRQNKNWLKKLLSELCDIKHGFAFKSEFFTNKGDYVMLTPGNFYESGGYRDRGEKQKYYCGQIPNGFILKKGDLLVAMTEQAAGLLGSPIIVPESNKYLHNQRLGLVTKKPGVSWTNEFFFHVFNTRIVRQELHDSASGVKVRHTSPKKIGDVEVSFPPSISEQRSIVSTLEELQKSTIRLETIYQKKLAGLEELKKSVLQKAFNGELSGAN